MSAAIKVGDVVEWAEAPDGALVRRDDGQHAIKSHGRGFWAGPSWCAPTQMWIWWVWSTEKRYPHVTVIALNVPAGVTVDDLKRLAEVFSVREALLAMNKAPTMAFAVLLEVAHDPDDHSWDGLAQRLHAARWRPGMSAEEATRCLLSEAGR